MKPPRISPNQSTLPLTPLHAGDRSASKYQAMRKRERERVKALSFVPVAIVWLSITMAFLSRETLSKSKDLNARREKETHRAPENVQQFPPCPLQTRANNDRKRGRKSLQGSTKNGFLRGIYERALRKASIVLSSHLALFLLLRSLSNVRSVAVARMSDATRVRTRTSVYILQGSLLESRGGILFASLRRERRRCAHVTYIDTRRYGSPNHGSLAQLALDQ